MGMGEGLRVPQRRVSPDFASLDVSISGSVHTLQFPNWPDLYFTLNQILIHVLVFFQSGSVLSSSNHLQQNLGLKRGNR